MRDPKRIERVIQQLYSAWRAFPDMRLGQLVLNITRAETTSELWNLEDDQMERLLETFTNLKIAPRGLRYVKRRWAENRGDRHHEFGHSWWYFEIDPACNVIRQVEQYDNGMILGYDSGMSHDEFGGLATEPLDASLNGLDFTNDTEFNQLWGQRSNTQIAR